VEGLVTQGFIRFRVVAPSDMLCRDLGAGADPESWMQAFNDNAAAIEHAALRVHQSSHCSVIILQLLEGQKRA